MAQPFVPLQLADVPIQPRAIQFADPGILSESQATFDRLSEIPVRQARRQQEMADSRLQTIEAKGRTKRVKNFESMLPDTATPIDLALTEQYVKDFGHPPVDATGKIDLAKLSDRVAKSQESRRKREEDAAAAKSQSVIQTVLDDEKGQPHRWIKIIDAQGNVVKETDLGIDSATASTRLRQNPAMAKAQADKSQELINLRDALGQVREVKELTKPGAPDVVGPVAGNVITRAGQTVGAALGVKGSQDTLNRQAKLRFLVSDLILNNASKLKGPLSDKDIKFLQASVPKLTDDNVTWQEYLNRFEKLLLERQTALGAPAAAPAAAAPASEVAQPDAAPGAPAQATNELQEGEKFFAHPTDPNKVLIQKLDGSQVESTREEARALAQARAARRTGAPPAQSAVKPTLADAEIRPAQKTINPNIAKSRLTLADVAEIARNSGWEPGIHEIDGVSYNLKPDGTVELVLF